MSDLEKEEIAPPPGLGFNTDESINKAPPPPNAQIVPVGGQDSKTMNKYMLKRIETKIPDSMALYEQNSYVQTFLIMTTAAVAIANLVLNFEMLELYEQQESELKATINKPLPDAALENQLLSDYLNRTEAGEFLCDVEYFCCDETFDPDALLDTVTLMRQVATASCYLAAILFVPIHLIFKTTSAFFLATKDFDSGPAEQNDLARQTKNAALHSMGEKQGAAVKLDSTTAVPKPVAMTRAHQRSMILENEDEKAVRVFLRGETVLFAWVQGFQDIPQGSLAFLYIVVNRSIRGNFCFDNYVEGQVVGPQAYDQIDQTAYLMLGLVFLSTMWNSLILGARWVKYFHYRTLKFQRKPRSLTYRLAVALTWSITYLLAVATPVFAIVYSGLGDTLIGYDEDSVDTFFVLTIIGGVCSVFGFFLICCWWGTNFAEGFCVSCVIWEAFCVATTACEFEVCEFCDFCCCC